MTATTRSAIAGFDTQLTRLGWAVVDIDTHEPIIQGCEMCNVPDDWIEQQVYRAVRRIDERLHHLDVELVFTAREHPFARGGKQQLLHGEAIGYLLAAHHLVWRHLPDPVPYPVTTWKAAAVGKGNATKADVLAWAVELTGDGGIGQDAADALGVAVCAALHVTQGEAA